MADEIGFEWTATERQRVPVAGAATGKWSRRLVAPLLVAAVLAAPAAASAAGPLRHDLGLVDGHLRIAIEYAPRELGESIRGAEIICRLGERAAAGHEADLAAADRTTLRQLIDEKATAESRRIEVAFRNADSVLRDLRGRFERSWADSTPRLRELRRGVGSTRRGIAAMRAVVAGLEAPFDDWRADECEAAALGVTRTLTSAPAALERINSGMLRLWRLADPPSPRTERR